MTLNRDMDRIHTYLLSVSTLRTLPLLMLPGFFLVCDRDSHEPALPLSPTLLARSGA